MRQKPAGGSKAVGLPHPYLSPFPPLPLSIPPKFSDKPVGGKVRSSDGEVPRLPPYKYHPDYNTLVTENDNAGNITNTLCMSYFYTEFPKKTGIL